MTSDSLAQARTEQRYLRRLFWWSFVLRFTIGMLAWLATLYLDMPLVRDAAAYEEAGASIAEDWLHGRSASWLQEAPDKAPRLLVAMIGCFYVFTMGVRLLPLLIAAYSAITAHAPGYAYIIAKQVGASDRAARASGWLVALTPAFAFWSGALYKEGLILLLLGIIVHHGLRLQSEPSPRSFWIMLATIIAMFFLRFYVAAILMVMVTFGLTQGRRRRGESLPHLVMLRQGLIVLALVVAAVALANTRRVQDTIILDIDEGLEFLDKSRADLATANSGYLRNADVSTREKALKFLPVGTACFLIVPLPWQTGTLRQDLGIPDTALWLLLYPLVVIGMIRASRTNFPAVLFILGVTLAICCLYGLFIGNIGTAFRLRIQVWYLWAVFVGMGWETFHVRRRFIRRHADRSLPPAQDSMEPVPGGILTRRLTHGSA